MATVVFACDCTLSDDSYRTCCDVGTADKYPNSITTMQARHTTRDAKYGV